MCCLNTGASGEAGRALAESAETDGVGARRGGDDRAGAERDQEAGTAGVFGSLESRLDDEGNGGFAGLAFGFLGRSGGLLFGPRFDQWLSVPKERVLMCSTHFQGKKMLISSAFSSSSA